MDSLKRLGIPFSILIVCALLQRLMDTYLRGSYTQTFHTIFLCAALFFFGYFLNAKYKKISNAESIFYCGIVAFAVFTAGYFTVATVKQVSSFFWIRRNLHVHALCFLWFCICGLKEVNYVF